MHFSQSPLPCPPSSSPTVTAANDNTSFPISATSPSPGFAHLSDVHVVPAFILTSHIPSPFRPMSSNRRISQAAVTLFTPHVTSLLLILHMPPLFPHITAPISLRMHTLHCIACLLCLRSIASLRLVSLFPRHPTLPSHPHRRIHARTVPSIQSRASLRLPHDSSSANTTYRHRDTGEKHNKQRLSMLTYWCVYC